MNRNTRTLFALAASAIAATSLFADTQTWNPAEGSALWNLTAPNWDDGAVWGGEGITNSAVFAADEGAELTVEGDVPVDGVEVQSGTWTFGGDGTLWLSGVGDYAESAWPLHLWEVKSADAAVTVSAAFAATGKAATFKKDGPGALTFTGPVDAGAIHSNDGRLSFIGNTVYTPRLRASFANSSADLLLDGATFRFYPTKPLGGDNVPLGEYDGSNFAHCWLGEGGVTFHPTEAGNFTVPQAISTAPGVARDGGVQFRNGTMKFTGVNTFNGGIHVTSGQFRVTRREALSSGDLELGSGATFFVVDREVLVTNRIVIGADATWMGSTDGTAARLGLTRLAFAEGYANRRVSIGRQGTGYGRVLFALDGEESEPVRNFVLRGDTELSVDGGVFTAETGSATPFFNTAQLKSDPVLLVERGGLAFDTAGASLDLGLTPVFQGETVTNFTEVVGGFANPGFESAATGWSYVTGKFSGGGRYENGSAFTKADPAFDSPDGRWYFVVRQLCTLTGSFTVPADGDWAVSFLLGCRPDAGYAGHKVSVTVKIDPDTADERSFTIGPRAAVHPFTRFTTDAYPLAAGVHTLRLETDAGNAGQQYESLLVDAFACCRRDIAYEPGAPLVKKGAGRLVVDSLKTDGRVTVEGGTLRVPEVDLDGAAVNVADGGRLELDAGRVTNATVSVAAGGTLSLRAGVNLISYEDSDFERVDVGQATDAFQKANGFWQVSPICGWTFETTGSQTAGSGIQRDGSAMAPAGWKRTPSGCQTVFLRSSSTMSRTVEVPKDGTYEVSFLHAARNYNDGYNIPLTVKVDGEVVCELPARTGYYEYTRLRGTVKLEAGAHTLAIEAGGGTASGKLLYIDDVRVVSCDELGLALDGNQLDLASGATLDLQNPVPLYLSGGVYVDGVKFTGGRARLERKGVTVTGAGDIQVGAPDGSVLLLR